MSHALPEPDDARERSTVLALTACGRERARFEPAPQHCSYWREREVALPTVAMLSRAIPGLVQPKGRIGGFFFREKMKPDERTIPLVVSEAPP